MFVVDVRLAAGGLFVAVFASSALSLVDEQQRQLERAKPLFRTALAQDLTRKRVPTIQLIVVPDLVIAPVS